MLNKLKPKSEFSRNVLTLMTGTTIAQAIPIAISPILTRIYTPEDFGVFALFVAITSIFGSIANGRYELAIMLPEKDEDAINIFALGFIITSVISLTLLILVILFHDYFVTLLNNKEIDVWLYFVPLVVFFIGLFNILNYFNNRKKQYIDIANANIIKSIVLAITQLLIGFIKSGVAGLISGQILSQVFANMRLLKNIIKDKKLMSNISKTKIIALAKRYKNFPKISLLTVLLNVSSIQITIILISFFYNSTILGYFSLVRRVLAVPLSVIGSSVVKVFYQEAVIEKQKTGKAIKIFNYTAKKLFVLSFFIFIILYFTIEDIFSFVFGSKWSIAGEYGKILLPYYFINFISSPLDEIINVFEKLNILLFMNFLLFIMVILAFLFVFLFDLSFINFLFIYSYLLAFIYLLFLFYSYKISKGEY